MSAHQTRQRCRQKQYPLLTAMVGTSVAQGGPFHERADVQSAAAYLNVGVTWAAATSLGVHDHW